jgi:hypothetical protein
VFEFKNKDIRYSSDYTALLTLEVLKTGYLVYIHAFFLLPLSFLCKSISENKPVLSFLHRRQWKGDYSLELQMMMLINN